jgi:hypothetical protein
MDSELVSGVKQLMSPTKVALPSGFTNEAKIVSRKPYDENSIDRVQEGHHLKDGLCQQDQTVFCCAATVKRALQTASISSSVVGPIGINDIMAEEILRAANGA